MSHENTLRQIKVFFAGPQDVGEERDALPKLLDTANDDFAHDRQFHLESLDWTQVPPGAGPPQPRITPKVRNADLVIFCFWVRWGVPPGGDSPYTSGTEEEFYEALDEWKKNGGARPEIWLFFRDVPAHQLADQGPQLQKVREFQAKVESERLVMYQTYRDPQDWGKRLLDYLRTWLRDGGPGHPVTTERPGRGGPQAAEPLLAQIEELKQALAEAQKAPVKLREAALQHAIRATTAHNGGDLLSAEALYAQALDLDEHIPEAHTNYALLLAQTARPQEAETHFKRALELREEYPEAHTNYALLLAQAARPQEAETHYLRALELREEFPEVHNNYANLLRQTARPQEAETHYKRALELREEYPLAHHNYANLLAQAARPQEAETHYKRALELREEYPLAHMGLALLLLNQDREEEAAAHLARVQELAPELLLLEESGSP